MYVDHFEVIASVTVEEREWVRVKEFVTLLLSIDKEELKVVASESLSIVLPLIIVILS